MIIPIRCFSCGKPIADKYFDYLEIIHSETKQSVLKTIPIASKNFSQNIETPEEKAFEKLGIERQCCRRMFLTNVDYTNII